MWRRRYVYELLGIHFVLSRIRGPVRWVGCQGANCGFSGFLALSTITESFEFMVNIASTI